MYIRPELPFLAAGITSIVGGAIEAGKWPENVVRSVVGTVALVVVTSATSGTRIAPLVRAIGFLLLLTTVIAAVKAVNKKKVKK